MSLNLKKSLFIALATCSISSYAALSEVTQELKDKLNKNNGFNATFTQRIVAVDGTALPESTGDLTVKRPNFVRWHTKEPDETLIMANGDNLWFYDPMVEEVSIYRFNDSVKNTPILLLTDVADSVWQQYQISQPTVNQYLISSDDNASQVKSLRLTFNDEQLVEFVIVDTTEQVSTFTLSSITTDNLPDDTSFNFSIPDGVHTNDQRN